MNIRKFKNVNNELERLLTAEAERYFNDSDYNIVYQKYNDKYRLTGWHVNDYMIKDTTLKDIAEFIERDYLDYVEFLKEEGYE